MTARLSNALIAIGFLPILIIPTLYTFQRSIILVISMLLGIAYLFSTKQKIKISTTYLILFLLLQSIFLVPIIVGIYNNLPGAISFFNVFILYPIFYFILSILLIRQILVLEKFLLISLVANIILAIFLSASGFLFPEIWEVLNENVIYNGNFGAGVNEIGMPEYVIMGYVSLLYGSIFYIYKNLFSMVFTKSFSLFLVVKIILCIIVIFLSGQRSFLLALFLTICLTFFISIIYCYKKNIFIKIKYFNYVFRFIAISMPVFFYFIYNILLSELDFVSSAVDLRSVQVEMFNTVANSHGFFGSGFGYVGEMIRSEDMPWAYEVSYHLLLGSMGVIFFSMLILVSLIIFINSFVKIVSHTDYFINFFPHILALISVMIISAFNPFLFKFDVLWVFFLPIISWASLKNGYKYGS